MSHIDQYLCDNPHCTKETTDPISDFWIHFDCHGDDGCTLKKGKGILLTDLQDRDFCSMDCPHLAEDLVAAELPGILNWCLEGLKKYQESGLPVPADHFASYQTKKQDEDQALAAAVEES